MFKGISQNFIKTASVFASVLLSVQLVNLLGGAKSTMDLSLRRSSDSDLVEVKFELMDKALWQQFDRYQTEMIITKTGRRMFPSLRTKITGLNPSETYLVMLEFRPVDSCRFKFSSAKGWLPVSSNEPQHYRRYCLHPDSPSTGEKWMEQPISFYKVKLTNTITAPDDHAILGSMRKYQPRIIIIKTSDQYNFQRQSNIYHEFPETMFIAVTAYQNTKITSLKIDNNPFAKGFRTQRDGKPKRKRQGREGSSTLDKVIKKEPGDSSSESCSSAIPYDTPSTTSENSSASEMDLVTRNSTFEKDIVVPAFRGERRSGFNLYGDRRFSIQQPQGHYYPNRSICYPYFCYPPMPSYVMAPVPYVSYWQEYFQANMLPLNNVANNGNNVNNGQFKDFSIDSLLRK